MIEYRKLTHSDYDDIVEISKDLWNGCDYLPQIFHKWVDARGVFLGAVDTDKSKVVGAAKYSVMSDGSGWLEGLRVHKDYRGQKIAKVMSDMLLSHAKEELSKGYITKIGFGTHLSNIESRSMMEKNDFHIEQKFIIISKEYKDLGEDVKLEDFKYENWDVSYEEFLSHSYFKRRDDILPLSFVFQKLTKEVFDHLKVSGSLFKVNGYPGIYQFKGEADFISLEETPEAISTIMDCLLLRLKDTGIFPPYTSVFEHDAELIQALRDNSFISWSNWEPDYLYYVCKQHV